MGTEELNNLPPFSWWRGRRVIVTGCTGFLGGWVTKLLCDVGAHVVGIARRPPTATCLFHGLGLSNRVRLSYGSLEDYSFLERSISDNAAEVIFHAAGQSDVGLAQKNPRATFEINIRGTWNLLEACRCAAPPVRVLFISSEAVYRNRHTHQPEENRPPQVLSPYAASKLCGEILGRTYFHAYGLPFDTVRYSNLYGGGDSNFSRLIPGTIRSVLRGQPPIIRGNGTPLRDYLYVEDAARAC